MHLRWTETQLAIRRRFQEIGTRSTEKRAGGRPPDFDCETWDSLLAAGLWHMVVPPEHGGVGGGWWDFTAALEGLASSLRAPGLLLSVIGQAGMVRALDGHGTDAQKRIYFDRILHGELSATAIADAESGTDVCATSTVLSKRPDETYTLSGTKYNIAHAGLASFVLVVCKAGHARREGISLAIVEADDDGVAIDPWDRKLGNEDLPTGCIRFDDVALAEARLLGAIGEGLRNLIDIVSLGRLYYGLTAGWIVDPYLADAIRFARRRETFGVPIIEHQYVQKRLTDIRVRLETSRWLAYGALDRLLSHQSDALMLCSIAKIVGAEGVVASALDLLKLFGSKGYQEGDVATFVKDALAYCSVGGTEEMHRKNIMAQMSRLCS